MATVRKALPFDRGGNREHSPTGKAHDALDAIASELRTLNANAKEFCDRMNAAEVELERLRQLDRDHSRRHDNTAQRALAAEAELKRVRAELWSDRGVMLDMQARLDRAVGALREITRRGDGAHPATREHWLTAKRALAEIEESDVPR